MDFQFSFRALGVLTALAILSACASPVQDVSSRGQISLLSAVPDKVSEEDEQK